MTDDETPRGFVQLSEYHRSRREIEQLREELAYAHWRLGNAAGDKERCVIAGWRLKLRRGDMAFLLRMVRANGRPIFVTDDERHTAKVYVCRVRAMLRANDGDPRMITTVDTVGYALTKAGLSFVETLIPELFRPLADVMGDQGEVRAKFNSAGEHSSRR